MSQNNLKPSLLKNKWTHFLSYATIFSMALFYQEQLVARPTYIYFPKASVMLDVSLFSTKHSIQYSIALFDFQEIDWGF